MSRPLINHTYHSSNVSIKNVNSGELYTVSGQTTQYYLRPLVGSIGIYDVSNTGNTLYGFVKGSYNSTLHTFTIEYTEDESYHPKVVYYDTPPFPTETIDCVVLKKAFLNATMSAFRENENDSKTCLRKSDLESNNLQFRDQGYVFGENHYSDNQIVALDDIESAPSTIVGSVFFYLQNGHQTSGGVTLSNSAETINYIDENLVNGFQYYFSPTSGSNKILRGADLKLRFSDLFSDGTNTYEYDRYNIQGSHGSDSISRPNTHNFLINISNVKANFTIVIYLKQTAQSNPCENDIVVAMSDDVIAINNSSNRFSGYQWYKNSTPISGATKQYYSDSEIKFSTDLYWCRCTLVAGGTVDTCPRMGWEIIENNAQEYYLNFTATSDATIDNLGLTSVGGEPIKRTKSNGNNSYTFVFDNPISEISDENFYDKDTLTSITIPDSVARVGSKAFYDCLHLNTVIIPNSVKFIESEAFFGCYDLASANIPNGVLFIGDKSFFRCYDLLTLTIPNSVVSIGQSAFALSGLQSIIIGNGTIVIENRAFESCNDLETAVIGNNVTSIGDYAFFNCNNLTQLTIGNRVMSIGICSFTNCAFTSITIPDSVITIENGAFSTCDNLVSVTIGSGISNIGQGSFNASNNLSTVTCKATNPPTLGSYSFTQCNIQHIYAPASSVNAYKSAAGWKDYADKIQAIQS